MARPQALVVMMAAFFAIASAAVGVAIVRLDHDDVRRNTEDRGRSAAVMLEERFLRATKVAEALAHALADHMAPAGASGSAAPLAWAAGVSNFYAVYDDGRLARDALGFHPVGTSFADRDWVRTLLAGRLKVPYVGIAAFDDSSRTFAFPIAVRAGRGAVAALVDIDDFRDLGPRLGLGAAPAFGVVRVGGEVVLRQPRKGGDVAPPFADGVLSAAVAESPEGSFRARLGEEGSERMVSYRRLGESELVAWVAWSDADAFEAWRWRAVSTAAAVAAGWAIMAALAVFALRQLARDRRASAHLANLNRDLERSNADLEQFAYVASHDLKEPLRNIASYVQLLQRRYQGRLDPDADAFIGYTVEGVARLQAIINELLAYSRIGTGQLSLLPVQAGVLVSTALAHLKGVIAEAQAVVEVKGPLPVVEADATQLGSLFQNLIANALKYRREDVRAEVVVGCDDGGATWEFYVRDNGIGIDQQYHQQIFDLFKRLHPRDRYSGTGIGLAICQRVVERHGGRIWVESQAGQGSTFHFTLPKRQVGV